MPACRRARSRRRVRPSIVPRSGWNADESIRRAGPSYATAIRLALVHHTAGRNGYTAAESPAIVRAIQLYHVKGNGWNDIGYNFLVDRFGTVFEGRYGGIERNVVGAHAEGFNTGSVGVAVLGEYSSLAASQKARDSLARLLAWRLDLAHVDPATTLSFVSGGNARFAAGLPVFLRAISAHRDIGFTDCPGNALYNLLSSIGGDVAEIGLPKLYAPTVTGSVPGTVRFRARLSAMLPWTVDVYDGAGDTVASSSGFGAEIDWSWDASLVRPGRYSYAIRAGTDVTPAVGAIGGGGEAALAISGLATRSGDGLAERRRHRRPDDDHLHADRARERDDQPCTTGSAAPVATIANKAWKRAAEHAVRFDAAALPDGIYQRRGRSRRHGRPPGRRHDAGRGHAHARRRAGGARGVLAERRRRAPTGSPSASRWQPRRGAAADPQGRQVDGDAVPRVRSHRVPAGSSGTARSESAGSSTGTTRPSSRRPTRSRRRRSRCRSAPTPASPACASCSGSRSRSGSASRRGSRMRFGAQNRTHDAAASGETRVWKVPRTGVVRVVAWDAAGNTSPPRSKR